MSFLQFWASDFWTVTYEQSVYWFLGVLFFLFILLVLAYAVSERLRAAKRQVSMPTWSFFVWAWAIMSLATFLMNQFFPIDTWYTRAYILVFQPLRVPLYVGYFGLGIYAHLRGWFSAEGYKPRLLLWTVLWLVSGLLYLVNRLFVLPSSPEPTLVAQIAHATLFNAFCLSSLLAGAAYFRRKVNQSSPFWSRLSASSYGIYYIHPLILYPLAYFFVPVSLPLFVKAPLVILLGILLSWAVSALVLTKAPILRRAFA
jgi:peptidoglycan/LPS O-acetylase OafA/YrhL